MITVHVGYEVNDWTMQVEESKTFEDFEEANMWSSKIMEMGGYDTTEFIHSEGEETMKRIINEYLDKL